VDAGSEKSAEPEDLPPLELTKLRDLTVERDSGDDRAPYISSASAVVRRAGHTYVIGDEELELGVFELSSDEPGKMRRALTDEGSEDKPDVEALSVLPPFEGAPYGAVLGLGSGSKPSRDRGFFWILGPRGELQGEPSQIDLKPLYDRLRDELSDLNVEGAAVLSDRFLVFHRGNGDQGRNAIAQLDLAEVMNAVTGERRLDLGELRGVDIYELGDLSGTPLCFSDATPVSDDLVVFTASAEAEDGSIEGSVVGTIDARGEVRRLRTIDRQWKVEGVHASVDSGVIDFVFVCDQDEDAPSPLLTATMPIEGGLEH
jgi:hypothetical protein